MHDAIRHPAATAMPDDPLASWVASRRDGWTLPQPFFVHPEVYRADIERIWRAGWLFAGHSCEVREPGDYLVVPVDTDSILVVRGEGGALHAMHNVCRHRGSALCDEPCGRLTRIVCPYHQWAYGLDGRLLAWRGMQPSLSKEDFALHAVQAREVEGLIFIHLGREPAPFEAAEACLAPLLRPQGLARAKVARRADYLVHANWKVVWENNRECYHCNVNHPQYIRANFDHFNADDTSPAVRGRIEAAVRRGEQRWQAAGLAPTHRDAGMTRFPDAEGGIWYSANRTPLADGWLSETVDGQPCAPLMGDYQDPDVGTLRVRTLPNFWNHSSCDHSVSTRLMPMGPQLTALRVWWLVDARAEEGRDYDLARLMPFWQLTSEQDWAICERQQRGIASTAYTPGPYSTFKEYNVDAFVRWYLKSLRVSR